MDLALKLKELSYHAPLERKVLTAEETVEFALSDYCADAGRILSWHTECFLKEKRLAESGFELAGEVCVTVLYLAADGDGIRSCAIKVPFSLKEETRSKVSFLEAALCCEGCECRLLNARRILCRCRVAASVTPYEERVSRCADDFAPEASLGICRRMLPLEAMLTRPAGEKEFRFADSMMLGGHGGVEEVLFTRVSPRITEVTCGGDKVMIKGEMRVFALCKGEDGALFTASGNLPFVQLTERTEGAEEARYEAAAEVLDHTAALVIQGAAQQLEVQVTARLCLKAKIPCRTEYLADLYGIRCETETETEVMTLPKGEETITRSGELRATVETGLRPQGILGCDAVCGAVKKQRQGDGFLLTAPLTVTVLYTDENGAPACIRSAGECRVTPEAEAGSLLTGEKAIPTAVTAVITEGGIEYRAEAEFTGSIRTVQRCAAVVAVRAEEGKSEEQRPSLALRRMGKEDTLWHLAKTHRTTVEAIEKANESSWEEGEFLLIPKARV